MFFPLRPLPSHRGRIFMLACDIPLFSFRSQTSIPRIKAITLVNRRYSHFGPICDQQKHFVHKFTSCLYYELKASLPNSKAISLNMRNALYFLTDNSTQKKLTYFSYFAHATYIGYIKYFTKFS